MGINGVSLEMVWKRSKKELIEDTALVDVEIILDLFVTPGGQVAWMVVGGVETVASRQTHSV